MNPRIVCTIIGLYYIAGGFHYTGAGLILASWIYGRKVA